MELQLDSILESVVEKGTICAKFWCEIRNGHGSGDTAKFVDIISCLLKRSRVSNIRRVGMDLVDTVS